MQRPITGLRYKSVAALLACGSMGMPFAVAARDCQENGKYGKGNHAADSKSEWYCG